MPIQPVSGVIESDIINLNNSYLDSKIESVNGGPGGFFTTESELKAAYPNGSDRFFVVGGYSYWWKTNQWIKGDVFPTSGVGDGSVTNVKTDLAGMLIPTTYNFVAGKEPINNTTTSKTRAYTNTIFSVKAGDRIEMVPNSNYQFAIFDASNNTIRGWSISPLVFEKDMTLFLSAKKINETEFTETQAKDISNKIFITSDKTITNYDRFMEATSKQIKENNVISTFDKEYNDLLFNSQITNETILKQENVEIAAATYKDFFVYQGKEFEKQSKLYIVLKTGDLEENTNLSFLIRRRNDSSSGWVQTASAIFCGNGTYFASLDVGDSPDTSSCQILIDNRKNTTPLKIKQFYLSRDFLYADINIVTESTVACYVSSKNGNDTNDGKTKTTAVATFTKAQELGAKKIYAERGVYENQTIKYKNVNDIQITPYGVGDGIVLKNGTTYKADTKQGELYVITFSGNSRFKQVFTDKTLTPDIDNSNRPSFNAGVWQNHEDWTLDQKLKPVLSTGECNSTKGSFYWDGNKVYINPLDNSQTPKKFTIHNDVEEPLIIDSCQNVILEEVIVNYAYSSNLVITNCSNVTLKDCQSNYNMLKQGFKLDDTNANLYRCKATKACNDGFNMHGTGTTNFFECVGIHNYDDGISHHNKCVGIIDGGIWSNNSKAGIAPTYGAEVTIKNAFCHDNMYGIYALFDNPTFIPKIMISNTACYNNRIGLLVKNYEIVSFASKFINNTKEDTLLQEQGSIVEVGV